MKTFAPLVAGSAVARTLSASYGSHVVGPMAREESCEDSAMVDNDNDGTVNPWAYEIPDDGLGQDCDGSDLDSQSSQ